MAPYRTWNVTGSFGSVHVQTGAQVIGREGLPGAYVHHSGHPSAVLDPAALDELARVVAEAAADVRRRTPSSQTPEQLRQVMESRRAGGPDNKLTGDEFVARVGGETE